MKFLFTTYLFFSISTFLHAQKEDHVKGQFIVHLKNEGKVTDLNATLNKLKSRIVASKSLSDEMNIWLLDLDEFSTETKSLVALRNDPSVLNVQLNHFVSLRSSTLATLPNDPTFNSLWHHLNTGQSSGTAGADIQATLAWDITTGGKTTDNDTIVVAVIDNGFEPTHADIQANHWYNWNEIPNNGIDDDANGYVDDFNGWDTNTNTDNILGGTHAVEVEGIIGAVGNNNRGVTGVNWKVKMMSIKIAQKGTEADIVAAYAYALKMRRLYQKTSGKKGAFVVVTNSSFGIGGFPVDAPIWCAMYDTLGSAGILSVGSTDNSNSNVDVVGDLPSTCPSDYLVIVTSTDRNDVKGQNSAYGVNHVDVAAPGVLVQTTAPNSSYIVVDGTSFACPIVSGIAALVYAAPCTDFINLAKLNPSAATLLLKDWVFKSVDLKPSLQNKIKTGGRVNAFKTLQKALSYCTTCQQPSAVKTSFTNTSANFSFSLPQNASFTARFRLKGATIWTSLNATTTPLSINDLLACTDYELELVSKCNSTNSTSFVFPFKTEGCCVAPEEIQISNITQNQFSLKFAKIQAASQYSICVNNVGNLNSCVFEKITTDTNFIVNNLKICNTYKIAIKSECVSQVSAATDFNVKTMGCGPCFDKVYCKTSGSTNSEWIDSFSIADFKFKSGINGGYIKFDTLAAVLKSGKKYQLSLKPAYSSTAYNESLRVWIDFNGDGDFEEANEKIWEVAKFNSTVKSDSILMPDNFIEGITRMRVSMKYLDALAVLPQYCDFFQGEVEDYCVKLEKTTKLPILISDNEIHLFPNPFSNNFTVKNGDTSNRIVKLELIYPDGRVFYVKNFDTLETEIVVSDVPKYQMGLIFVKMETVKGVIVKKMMRF